MIFYREKRLRTLLTVLAGMIAPASASTAFAQGFGPDPFRPYNSQYDAYTYPQGPASPAGGGRRCLAACGQRGGQSVPTLPG